MIEGPLYQNPLAGGQKILVPNPGAVTPRGGAEMIEMIDPIMQGFQESEFRKGANNMQQDAVYFKYKGKDMQMNSSMAGAFKKYLDSIGKGNLYESELSNAGPLATVSGPNDRLDLFAGRPVLTGDEERVQAPPLLDGTKGFPVTVSGPEGIASTATVPGTNQFQGFDDRLTKIEEGIASLLQNRGQQFNFGMQPRFDFGMQPRFNMSGLGYFFNPQGGFYG